MAKKAYDFTPLKNEKYVCLDIETTGFDPSKGGRIIEIGAVKIINDEIGEEFSTFINPGMKIPSKIVGLTGITDEMVKNAPTIFQVLREFSDWIGNVPVICHNVSFDWTRYLYPQFLEIGDMKENVMIDTLKLSKEAFPYESSYKLNKICGYCKVPLQTHHRAIDDAKMTAKCFIHMKEIFSEEIEKVEIPIVPYMNLNPTPKVRIGKVSYWKKGEIERQYINLYYDDFYLPIFYDINQDFWKLNSKEYKGEVGSINWDSIKTAIIDFLKLDSLSNLKTWR